MLNQVDPTFEFVRQLSQELSRSDFDLPPFPDTALRVQSALRDPDIDIRKLGAIVLSEPALAARLLRMSNSAVMRRGSMEVTDINTAIARIGLTMVQNVAVSFAARAAFKAPRGSIVQEYLESTRLHSFRVAALAYMLGRKVQFVGKADEAMLAGLLHTVGKFYILTRADAFPEVFADEHALQGLMDQWHTGIGRAIVESWGFPENVAQAVDEYEMTERDYSQPADITDVVLVANLVARASLEEPPNWALLEGLPSLVRLKLDIESLQALVQASQGEVDSMVEAMTG
tara:strand:- start:20039 stop:20899 length:861 start_codon:yes stop_codon:yes gene_type:complete